MELLHQLCMLAPDLVFLSLRPTKFELSSPFVVFERVDKQVQIVDLIDLRHKEVNVGKEFLWVHIVNHVDIDLVLPQ